MQELTDAKIRELVDEWIKDALKAEYDCLLDGGPWTPEKLEDHKTARSFRGHEAYERWELKDFRQIRGRVDAFLACKGLEVDKESMAYKKLCDALLKAEVDMMREVSNEAWEGPASEEVTPTSPTATTETDPKDSSPMLGEAVEKFIEVKLPTWVPKSRRETPHKTREFAEIVGKDLPLSKLDRDVMRFYRDVVLNLPTRRSLKKEYRDKTFKQLLKMDIPEKDKLTPKTIDNRFGAVGHFLTWCEDEGYLDRAKALVNTMREKTLEQKQRKTAGRAPFTDDDLRLLFNPATYAKTTRKSPERFWIPLLALYTGARVEELAQLHVSDIRTVEGVLVVDINRQGGKQLKTAAAERRVPVHPFLVEKMGFMEYVEMMSKQGGPRLFPELPMVEATGRYSDAVSKWFTQHRRKQGVPDKDEEGRSKVFHSFRHTFITRCKHLGLDRYKLKEIVGHEKSETDDVTATYEGAYPPATLLEDVVKKIDFHERVDELNRLKFLGIKM